MVDFVEFLRGCGRRGLSFSLGVDGGVVIGHDIDDLDDETLGQIRGRRHAIREVLVALRDIRVSRAELEAIAIVRRCRNQELSLVHRRHAKATAKGRKRVHRDAA